MSLTASIHLDKDGKARLVVQGSQEDESTINIFLGKPTRVRSWGSYCNSTGYSWRSLAIELVEEEN